MDIYTYLKGVLRNVLLVFQYELKRKIYCYLTFQHDINNEWKISNGRILGFFCIVFYCKIIFPKHPVKPIQDSLRWKTSKWSSPFQETLDWKMDVSEVSSGHAGAILDPGRVPLPGRWNWCEVKHGVSPAELHQGMEKCRSSAAAHPSDSEKWPVSLNKH